jgi:putative CocE/NonD family hydrolase
MKNLLPLAALAALLASFPDRALPVEPAELAQASKVAFEWGVRIPLRDGVRLNATVYRPRDAAGPQPCIFTLTPYISQSYHARGMYFASHGYPFLTVDVRGRGNSEGSFQPLIQEARDGYDVVEWLAKQPYCNGKVTMWGGSYAGYDQWATAKEFPPHLATIVPVASPYAGVDFPTNRQIGYPYVMQWLTDTSGHTSQDVIFEDAAFWAAAYRRLYESGAPFSKLDTLIGNPSPTFHEWLAHPDMDAYWDSYNPTAAEYAKIELPILSITGIYDDDQPGALEHYRQHLANASAAARARHYLVIGPWDHAGTRTPKAEVGGLKFGPASLVDLPQLHLDWYAWTLKDGPRPAFLKQPVVYYVTGAERWRSAESLAAITAESRPLYLDSAGNGARDVYAAGSLVAERKGGGDADRYRYFPLDTSLLELQAAVPEDSLVDQRLVLAGGPHLVYHSAPFERDTQVSGFFRLSAWIAIDQPDTDFAVAVYEVAADGSARELTSTLMRARYREGARTPRPVRERGALRYDFDHFTFTSHLVSKGSRLRLVIGATGSLYLQKNYNAGGAVAEESAADARAVTVMLYHDRSRPSALYVPIAAVPAAE